MRLRSWLIVGLLATSACDTGSSDLEARVKKLEDVNKKYAEALDALQQAYDAQKQQAAAQDEKRAREEPAPDGMFAIDIADDLKGGQVNGPATAGVTIIKAWDLACPYCERVSPTLEELVKEYDGKVRVVYKHLVVHPQAVQRAHQAICAAGKQGKFEEFLHVWWETAFKNRKFDDGGIEDVARAANIDVPRLKTDMESDECKQRVAADEAELRKFGVNSTPTFYINGTHVSGGLAKEQFKSMIDDKLKEVERSGVAPGDYYDKVVMATGEKKFRSSKDPKP